MKLLNESLHQAKMIEQVRFDGKNNDNVDLYINSTSVTSIQNRKIMFLSIIYTHKIQYKIVK